MQNKFNSNGRILFEGKSNIDGENIVVIITGLDNKTSNKKTGDMTSPVKMTTQQLFGSSNS